MARAALFVLCGTGEVEFGKKRVNIGILSGSNLARLGFNIVGGGNCNLEILYFNRYNRYIWKFAVLIEIDKSHPVYSPRVAYPPDHSLVNALIGIFFLFDNNLNARIFFSHK